MTLVLSIRNVGSLSNGGPTRVEAKRRGLVIGRSPAVDWTLPDPANFISSRHCEIRFENESYILRDISTNGTEVNGTVLQGSHRLATGDVVGIGHYEIVVQAPPTEEGQRLAQEPSWNGWNSIGAPVGAADAGSGWGKPKPRTPLQGEGLLGENWTPPAILPSSRGSPISPSVAEAHGPAPVGNFAAASPPVPASPVWDASEAGAGWGGGEPSAWSSPADPGTPSPVGRDIWGEMAQSHAVDWSQSSFGVAASDVAEGPLGLAGGNPADAFPAPLAPPHQPIAVEPSPAASPGRPGAGARDIAQMLGIDPRELHGSEAETLAAMASLLRVLVSGLAVMLEARARAKAQLSAQSTSLQFDGNNPIKFARTPEQALIQLLNPPERGFMTAERAVEDAFVDLQSHQMATLRGMQGALRETLARFSPHAIGSRFQPAGFLARILPWVRDAELWRTYIKEFSGVAQGSDEAFMEVFAREFRKAYDDESRRRR